MTDIREVPAASDGEDFEQGTPTTDSHGEAEDRANGHGGQGVNFADLMSGHEVPSIPRTRAEYANEINKTCGQSIESIIHRGLLGIGAERDLGRGDYGDMVKKDIRCSPGHMRKCKAIARNKFMANRSNWNALPPSVAKLYPLSGINAERLAILADEGLVHYKLTISQAKGLAEAEKDEDYRPQRKTRTPPRPAPAQRSRTGADLAEDSDSSLSSEDSEDTDTVNLDGGEDQEPDQERLAIDGEDLIENYKIARAGGRRMLDYMRQHGDHIVRGMVASGLREFAIALNRDADELDPPERTRNRNGPYVRSTSNGNGRAQSAPQSPGCDIDTYDPADVAEDGDDPATVDDAAPPDPAERARQRTVKTKAKVKAK